MSAAKRGRLDTRVTSNDLVFPQFSNLEREATIRNSKDLSKAVHELAYDPHLRLMTALFHITPQYPRETQATVDSRRAELRRIHDASLPEMQRRHAAMWRDFDRDISHLRVGDLGSYLSEGEFRDFIRSARQKAAKTHLLQPHPLAREIEAVRDRVHPHTWDTYVSLFPDEDFFNHLHGVFDRRVTHETPAYPFSTRFDAPDTVEMDAQRPAWHPRPREVFDDDGNVRFIRPEYLEHFPANVAQQIQNAEGPTPDLSGEPWAVRHALYETLPSAVAQRIQTFEGDPRGPRDYTDARLKYDPIIDTSMARHPRGLLTPFLTTDNSHEFRTADM
jgi:hypothetical protein